MCLASDVDTLAGGFKFDALVTITFHLPYQPALFLREVFRMAINVLLKTLSKFLNGSIKLTLHSDELVLLLRTIWITRSRARWTVVTSTFGPDLHLPRVSMASCT